MTTATSNLAPFYGDYVADYLGKAQGLATLPFQPYTGDMFAGPSALQQQAFSGIGGLTASPYFNQAAGMLGQAGDMATVGSGYTPTTFSAPGYTAAQVSGNFGYNPATYGSQGYNAAQVSGDFGYNPTSYNASTYNAQTMTAPEGIGSLLDASDWGTVQDFMNPYAQGVTDIALRRATDTFGQQAAQRGAAAHAAGAFGGSRHGIVDALAGRDFNQQLDDIQMRGGDAAFRAAIDALQNQRSTDLNRQQFNSQMQYNTGLQNMLAQNQAGQFNAGALNQAGQFNAGAANQAAQFRTANAFNAAMQNAQAQNQASQFGADAANTAGLQNMLAWNQASQFGIGNAFNAAMQNAQAQNQAGQFNAGQNLTAQQLTDASKQFGAQNYNQGIQSLLSAGTGLGDLGTAESATQQNIYNQMLNAGATQQAFAQQPLDFGYQQWVQSLQYPYQQLQFQQQMLQGLPLSVNQSPDRNALLEGLMGAGGIYDLLFKKG